MNNITEQSETQISSIEKTQYTIVEFETKCKSLLGIPQFEKSEYLKFGTALPNTLLDLCYTKAKQDEQLNRSVFAKTDINANVVLGCIPIQYIKENDTQYKSVKFDETVNIPDISNNLQQVFDNYSFNINGTISCPNPYINNSTYIGHIINDCLNLKEFLPLVKNITITKENYPSIVEYYKKNSIDLSNVMFTQVPNLPLVVVVSKKPILKDQELFVSYGHIYWLKKTRPDLDSEYIKDLESY